MYDYDDGDFDVISKDVFYFKSSKFVVSDYFGNKFYWSSIK